MPVVSTSLSKHAYVIISAYAYVLLFKYIYIYNSRCQLSPLVTKIQKQHVLKGFQDSLV